VWRLLPGIKQDNIKTIPITSQKIGFFNMVKVMMESKRALTSLQRLNDRKARLSKNLVGMRGMYSELKTLQLQSNQKNQNPTRLRIWISKSTSSSTIRPA
jgi:hypothetical protein